jgi:outer membrane protein assembly factor BamB
VALSSVLFLGLAACTAQGGDPVASSTSPSATTSATTSQSVSATPSTQSSSAAPIMPWQRKPKNRKGYLAPGSDPSVLPGPIVIADKLNNRLIIVDPRGRIRWTYPVPNSVNGKPTLPIPDDVFFTPDGQHLIATEEDAFMIRVIDILQRQVVFHYGKEYVHGTAPNRLWNPDDAIMLPDGRIVVADIKNQRLLVLKEGLHHWVQKLGDINHGYHQPPTYFGAPNGFFPVGGGKFLVTEIRGDWIDMITLKGKVLWTTHAPGVAYPSDTNKVGPNKFLTVDYASPGQVVMFNRQGKLLWRFTGTPGQPLDHPSLAEPLPNGDILVTDDYNHRVIVVDPNTNKVVWQYGHYGQAGKAPGYLYNPDGLDLAPPYSLIDRVTAP